MSYSYARYKKAHDEVVAAINRRDVEISVAGVGRIEFEFILWPHYSDTVKVNRKGESTLEFYAQAFDLGGMPLPEFRDATVNLHEVVRKNNYKLTDFFEDVMDELPHGSGIDADWTLGEVTDKDVTFCNSYHTMDEWGGYDGWLDFAVTYEYDFAARTVKSPSLKLGEDEWKRELECGDCFGEGYYSDDTQCATCGGTGLVEYDHIDDHREYLASLFDEGIKING